MPSKRKIITSKPVSKYGACSYNILKTEPIIPVGFRFVKSSENPDFAVQNHYYRTYKLVINEGMDKIKLGIFVKLDSNKNIDSDKLVKELKVFAYMTNYSPVSRR